MRLQCTQQGSEADKHGADETMNASMAYTVKVTCLETDSQRQIHGFFFLSPMIFEDRIFGCVFYLILWCEVYF